MKVLILTILTLLLIGCEDRKKIFVREFSTQNGYYQWYYYSDISSNSPDHIDFVTNNCERTLVYKGDEILDVDFDGDSITVKCKNCNTIELNSAFKSKLKVIEIDNNRDLLYLRKQKDSLVRIVKVKGCD